MQSVVTNERFSVMPASGGGIATYDSKGRRVWTMKLATNQLTVQVNARHPLAIQTVAELRKAFESDPELMAAGMTITRGKKVTILEGKEATGTEPDKVL